VSGLPLNGEIADLPEPWKGMAEHLSGLPHGQRATAWQAMLSARPDRDELVDIMIDIDPEGLPPEEDIPQFATAADVRRQVSLTRWLWEGWIAAGSIVGVAAFEGTGKTRFLGDLARRVYLGLP
jgi:hypothetical protein